MTIEPVDPMIEIKVLTPEQDPGFCYRRPQRQLELVRVCSEQLGFASRWLTINSPDVFGHQFEKLHAPMDSILSTLQNTLNHMCVALGKAAEVEGASDTEAWHIARRHKDKVAKLKVELAEEKARQGWKLAASGMLPDIFSRVIVESNRSVQLVTYTPDNGFGLPEGEVVNRWYAVPPL